MTCTVDAWISFCGWPVLSAQRSSVFAFVARKPLCPDSSASGAWSPPRAPASGEEKSALTRGSAWQCPWPLCNKTSEHVNDKCQWKEIRVINTTILLFWFCQSCSNACGIVQNRKNEAEPFPSSYVTKQCMYSSAFTTGKMGNFFLIMEILFNG